MTSTNAFAVTDRGFFHCVTPSDNVAALMGATASELSSFCGSNYKENILSFLNASEGKTAMGYGAWVEGQNATALGTKAKAYEEGDLAIGVYATATGKDSSADVSTRNKMMDAIKRTETYGPAMAQGAAATATGRNAIAIGNNAVSGSTTGTVNTSINDTIAIGGNTVASGNRATAVGYHADATGATSVALGYAANAAAQNMVAIGNMAGNGVSTNTHGIAIGNSAGAVSGTGKTASGTENVAIGRAAGQNVQGNTNYAMGSQAGTNISGHDNFSALILAGSNVTGSDNIAIGKMAGNTVTASSTVSLGAYARGSASNAVAVGASAAASGVGAIAIGGASESQGKRVQELGGNESDPTNTSTYGKGAVAQGKNSIAIGTDAEATAEDSISIGTGNKVSGKSSGAIGDPNTILGDESYALGNNNTIAQNNTFVVGNDVNATQDNSVILGNDSADRAATTVSSATVNGITYGTFKGQGKAENGVVSVGASGKERQIINVAAGEVSANSTDAINGSQLYAVANKLGEEVSNTYFHTNNGSNSGTGNATTNLGKITDAAGATGDYALSAGYKAVASGSRAVAVGTESTAKGASSIAVGWESKAIGPFTMAMGRAAEASASGAMALGINSKATGRAATAVGSGANAKGIFSTATGVSAYAGGENSVASGYESIATGKSTAAVGYYSRVYGDSSVAIGDFSQAGDYNVNWSINKAYTDEYDKVYNQYLEDNNVTKETATESQLNEAYEQANQAATEARDKYIAQARADGTINSSNGGLGAIAIGNASTAKADSSIAVGTKNQVTGESSGVIGRNNIVTSKDTFVLGNNINTKVITEEDFDILTGQMVKYSYTEAIGETVENSVYLGNRSVVAKENGSKDGLGNDTVANVELKLSEDGNIVDVADGTTTTGGATGTVNSAKVNNITYSGFAGATSDGAVSVGASGAERRIQNVAAGQIAATSTDAINGSQLYIVSDELSKRITNATAGSTEEVKSGDKSVTVTTTPNAAGANVFNVSVNTDNTTIIKDSTTGAIKVNTTDLTVNGGKVETPISPNSLVNAQTVTNAINNSGFNVAGNGTKTGELVNPGDTVDFVNGNATTATVSVVDGKNTIKYDVNVDDSTIKVVDGKLVVQKNAVDSDTVTTVSGGDHTTVTNTGTTDAPNYKVDVKTSDITANENGSVTSNGSNVATADQVANAINKSGFKLTTSKSEGGEVSGTTEELINPSETVTIDAGKNIKVTQSGNKVSVATKDDVEFKTVKATTVNATTVNATTVKAGDTTINNDGVKVGDKVSLTKNGLDNGGNRIINVAPGVNDTDAVNVSQLKQVNNNVNQLNKRINKVDRGLRAGIAGSNAAAALPQVYLPGKSMVAASAGTYRGESAVAVGYSRASDNGKMILKLQGNANTRGDLGAGVGVGYQW